MQQHRQQQEMIVRQDRHPTHITRIISRAVTAGREIMKVNIIIRTYNTYYVIATVKPPNNGPPRSGQTLYNGQTEWNGMVFLY